MKQSQYRVGILAKIFFALAFGVLMAVVILATVLFLFMRQITDASVQDSVNVSTESSCQKLNTLIDRIRVASELIGSNEEIYVVPANGSMTPIKEMIMYDAPGENNETLRALVNDIVQNTTTFNSNFYSCFGHDGGAYVNKLFVATEFTVSRYLNKHQKLSDSGCGLYSAKSVENEAWYRETVRRDGEEYWFVQPDDPGYLCMARAITCNMLEGGQLKQYQLGVLALRFDISWVSDRIQVSTMTKDGKVLLTDPDGAGFVIRSHLKGVLPPDRLKQAYIPDIPGKERRKKRPGKEGKLGVEGMPPDVLLAALRRAGATFEGEGEAPAPTHITKADLLDKGLIGPNSTARRAALQQRLGLPARLTANGLLEALTLLLTREEFDAL